MTCPPVSDIEYVPTFTSDGTSSPIPNTGASICGSGVGVIRLTQKVPVTVRLAVKDEQGNLFVTTDSVTGKLTVRDMANKPAKVTVSSAVYTDGKVTFNIPGITQPGIYDASVTLYAAGVPKASTRYWVEVAATMDWINCNLPLTISEVRMEVRDQCGEQNALFDALKFSDDQVVWAIRKPIDEFNSTGQPETAYTPATFPGQWRSQWVTSAAGYLMRVASIGDDRDGLTYSAGGVQINDKDVSFVAKMSQQLIEEWRAWVRSKKVEINADQAWGTQGSDYGSGVWY